MQRDESDVALSVWAVTCDALARGEQIFLLVPGAAEEIRDLDHEEFWLLPDWERHERRALTEPYQDRMRALEDLRHRDRRVRLKYYATAEYVEALASPRHLHRLDGDHTLTSRAVADLFEARRGERRDAGEEAGGSGAGAGAVSLLVLRVHARPEATVVERSDLRPAAEAEEGDAGERDDTPGADAPGLPRPLERRWIRLPEPVSTAEMDPVVSDDRFVSLKARLLQRTGAIRAV